MATRGHGLKRGWKPTSGRPIKGVSAASKKLQTNFNDKVEVSAATPNSHEPISTIVVETSVIGSKKTGAKRRRHGQRSDLDESSKYLMGLQVEDASTTWVCLLLP